MAWLFGVPAVPSSANTSSRSTILRTLVNVRCGSSPSSWITSSIVRVLPSPIFTPPAAFTASTFTLIPSATAPSAATGPVSGAGHADLDRRVGDSGRGLLGLAAPAHRPAASMTDSDGVGDRSCVSWMSSSMWPGWKPATVACDRLTDESCCGRCLHPFADEPHQPVARQQHHPDQAEAVDEAAQRRVDPGGPVGDEDDEDRADEGAG